MRIVFMQVPMKMDNHLLMNMVRWEFKPKHIPPDNFFSLEHDCYHRRYRTHSCKYHYVTRTEMQLDFCFQTLNQIKQIPTKVYRFKRVMFGVNVSPFLLSATIKHHIENYREQYPAATEMLDTCLYVDEISGADDISQSIKGC
ncbi:hypothetical protein TNCV_2953891 [Trichonephila clavipes]|nr:hypothetical protein TNCV_2953891 [Trichonephila clavipes]